MALAAHAKPPRGESDPRALIANTDKLIVVTTKGWDFVHGRLQRYERKRGRWTQVADTVEIVVGKNGMGWTPMLPKDNSAPVKHEGDGKSPAGIFRLTQTFGFADALPGAKDYLALTPATECVDDVNSKHYAHIVDRDKVDVDWNSSEKMRDISLYRWGVVVPYNMDDTQKGAGSCIFLHIAPASGKGTAGCTAMPDGDIEEIVRWIGSGAVLVQMPEENYRQLSGKWKLP